MTIELLGFFSVPHLLWHGASVYNGYLRGPVTLTPIADRLAVELSLPVLRGLSRLGFEHSTFRLRAYALTHCATAAIKTFSYMFIYYYKIILFILYTFNINCNTQFDWLKKLYNLFNWCFLRHKKITYQSSWLYI